MQSSYKEKFRSWQDSIEQGRVSDASLPRYELRSGGIELGRVFGIQSWCRELGRVLEIAAESDREETARKELSDAKMTSCVI
jgi:hypothetical protein